MQLLHIDSSILSGHSVSRILTAQIVDTQRRKHSSEGLTVVYRDLAVAPLAHLSGGHFAARSEGAIVSPEIAKDVADGQAALEEFIASDIVVIGAPMYNFGISSQLKAWIDRLAIAGKTFRYTEKGPEGLAGGKRVIIASSRGGFYGDGSAAAFLDHQETYLRGVLGFFGITDLTFIRAEGIALGPDQREKAIASARAEINAAYQLAA